MPEDSPAELRDVGARRFEAAGVSGDERQEWLEHGFGHYAALNYRQSGLSPRYASAAHGLGMTSRVAARAGEFGVTASEWLERAAALIGCAVHDLPDRRDQLLEVLLNQEPVDRLSGWELLVAACDPTAGKAVQRVEDLDQATSAVIVGHVAEARWSDVAPEPLAESAWRFVSRSPVDAAERIRNFQRPIDAFDGVPAEQKMDRRRRLQVLWYSTASGAVTRQGLRRLPQPLRVQADGSPPSEELGRAFGLQLRVHHDLNPSWMDAALTAKVIVELVMASGRRPLGAAGIHPEPWFRMATDLESVADRSASSLGNAVASILEKGRVSSDMVVDVMQSDDSVDDEVLAAINTDVIRSLNCKLLVNGSELPFVVDDIGRRWWVDLPTGDAGADSVTSLRRLGDVWITRAGVDGRVVFVRRGGSRVDAAASVMTSGTMPLLETEAAGFGRVSVCQADSAGIVEVRWAWHDPQFIEQGNLAALIDELRCLRLSWARLTRVWLGPASPLSVQDVLRFAGPSASSIAKRGTRLSAEDAVLQINGTDYVVVPFEDGPAMLASADFDGVPFSTIAELYVSDSEMFALGRLTTGEVVAVGDGPKGSPFATGTVRRLSDVGALLWWVNMSPLRDYDAAEELLEAIDHQRSLELKVVLPLSDEERHTLRQALGTLP